MTQIKDVLIELNPWWKEKYTILFEEREIYQTIKKYVPLSQIISLTGLRRVGKTTIMKKIIVDSITEGFDKTNIIYFSFDEFRNIEIREIISEYESLMQKNIKKEKFILLLDEIQKLERWDDKLKSIYDLYSQNIKIIISGSESLYIRQKSKETLAGRIYEFKITLLTFKEFLKFKKIKYTPIELYEKELKISFNEFTHSLGFPELVNIQDKDIIKKYAYETVIEKTLFRDMILLYRIKDIAVLETIVNILMNNPGQMMELDSQARELGITRQTLSNYLKYLEESFFLKKIYNYSKNRKKVERKLKKYYPIIISPDLLFKEDDLSKSKILEWISVIQLNAEFFYRDVFKNEVDIVLTKDDKVTPLEVKYGKIDVKGLLVFMKEFNIKKGVILTNDKEDSIKNTDNKEIKIIPLYKFLLE